MLAQTTMLKSKRNPCILVELFCTLQDLSIYYFVAESSTEVQQSLITKSSSVVLSSFVSDPPVLLLQTSDISNK